MMLRITTAVLLASLFSVQVWAEATNGLTSGSATTPFGTRKFYYYAPVNMRKNSPLIVSLHGCFMTPAQMATGTGLNELADKYGFAVLYPEQTAIDNSWSCWNWFNPENLKRGDGELLIIVTMVKQLTKKLDIDPQRVFVTGISAGGAMTSNLVACYSDVFAGGLVHSGLEYLAATNENDAHKVMKPGPSQDLLASAQAAYKCSPPKTSPLRMIVVHGDADPFVGKINSDRIAEQFAMLNQVIAQQSGEPFDLKTVNSTLPAEIQYGLSADETDFYVGSQLVTKKIIVKGMGHGWSGGNTTAPYMEPRGINLKEIIVQYWLKK